MYIRRRPDLSWHVLRTWSRVPGRAVALCGRRIEAAETSDRAEVRDRYCLTCERIEPWADTTGGEG